MSLLFDIGELHRARYGRMKRVVDAVLAGRRPRRAGGRHARRAGRQPPRQPGPAALPPGPGGQGRARSSRSSSSAPCGPATGVHRVDRRRRPPDHALRRLAAPDPPRRAAPGASTSSGATCRWSAPGPSSPSYVEELDGQDPLLPPPPPGAARPHRLGPGEVPLRRQRGRRPGEAPVRVLLPAPPGPGPRPADHRPHAPQRPRAGRPSERARGRRGHPHLERRRPPAPRPSTRRWRRRGSTCNVLVVDNGSEPPATVPDDARVTLRPQRRATGAWRRPATRAPGSGRRPTSASSTATPASSPATLAALRRAPRAARRGPRGAGLRRPAPGGERRPGPLAGRQGHAASSDCATTTGPSPGPVRGGTSTSPSERASSSAGTAFEAVGGFDESYFYGPEDVDLCLRLRETGLPRGAGRRRRCDHPPRRRNRGPAHRPGHPARPGRRPPSVASPAVRRARGGGVSQAVDTVLVAYRSEDVIEAAVDQPPSSSGAGRGRATTATVVSARRRAAAGATVVDDPANPGFGAGQNRGVALTESRLRPALQPRRRDRPGRDPGRGRAARRAGRSRPRCRAWSSTARPGRPSAAPGVEVGPVHLLGRAARRPPAPPLPVGVAPWPGAHAASATTPTGCRDGPVEVEALAATASSSAGPPSTPSAGSTSRTSSTARTSTSAAASGRRLEAGRAPRRLGHTRQRRLGRVRLEPGGQLVAGDDAVRRPLVGHRRLVCRGDGGPGPLGPPCAARPPARTGRLLGDGRRAGPVPGSAPVRTSAPPRSRTRPARPEGGGRSAG